MAKAARKSRPRVVKTVKALREALSEWRKRKQTIALVPTMGALHTGHISLVALAKKSAKKAVVSIFVNPTQFGPNEDFTRYPRTLDADLDKLADAGADLVFLPDAKEMYPDGFSTMLKPSGPAAVGLDDKFRPGHFDGVATVVAKLFTSVMPDIAIFGDKDYQQLQVIRTMARDLHLPVKVIGAPIVREKDGLALSSRNVYLSPAERAAAPVLHRVLKESAKAIAAGEPVEAVLSRGRAKIMAEGFKLDYLEARDAATLAKLGDEPQRKPKVRLLVAAKIGKTRLIDNFAV
ncbi:MAG: pantoate--beta-alanine ligase [Xanthobacteraceae bacterium]|nr:pantoate--beta-alanine ligase [Xanthobacteraceae bacterium]MCW5677475.1 pantoate--beta-alanine ligase [Xanthobacteraceae bacterium]